MKHEPAQPVTLAKTTIIEIDGQSTDIPVDVIFRLSPHPRVVMHLEHIPTIALQKERFNVVLNNGADLESLVSSYNIGTGEGSLSPARQPVDILGKDSPLVSVHFKLLNFPEFYGNQIKQHNDGRSVTAIPHAKLETSGWCIELTGVSDISDVVKELRQCGGYGLTHYGVITRSHGADFSVDEVATLLAALRIFLSFAGGSYCSLALIEGRDQYGDQVWVRWGSHRVTSFGNRRSWLKKLHGDDIISELFPKFFFLIESDDGWKKTIDLVIDWYLQSNESPPYIGLILTQAALERLSNQILERRCEKGEPAGKFIEATLKKYGIESVTPIPTSCKELRECNRWNSGPHALVDIRNDLVHPIKTLEEISHYSYDQVWNLGQWYIEMLLLKRLSYRGSYVNRLASWEDQENQAILPVPWAQEFQK